MSRVDIDHVALTKTLLSYLDKPSNERQLSDFQPFFNSLTDDVTWKVTISHSTPLSGEFRGKQAVIDYFTKHQGIIEDHEVLGPVEWMGNGSRVVGMGVENYRIVKSGVTVRNREFIVVVDFREKLVSRVLTIKDVSEFALAYQSSESVQGEGAVL